MSRKGELKQITSTAHTVLPTKYGNFQVIVYKTSDNAEQVVLVKGEIKDLVLVRLHSSCITGDIFSSLKCDCGEQLKRSMEQIQKSGNGVILYLNQEGRGIGLTNKIKAYALQEAGYDTVEANEKLGFPIDARDYTVAAKILQDLGIKKIRLLTNNPDKVAQLRAYGMEVVEQVPLEIYPNAVNEKYLKTKKEKMSHSLHYV